MEMTGFDTKAAILKLRSKEEMQQMFDFAIDVGPSLDDEDKLATFGLFKNCPQKLCILPGLKVPFNEFLDAIEGKHPIVINDNESGQTSSTVEGNDGKKYVRRSALPVEALPTIQKLDEQLKDYCRKKGGDPTDKFIFEEKGTAKILFRCLVCKTTPTLVTITKTGYCLSNQQRHIKDECWLYNGPPKKKKVKIVLFHTLSYCRSYFSSHHNRMLVF